MRHNKEYKNKHDFVGEGDHLGAIQENAFYIFRPEYRHRAESVWENETWNSLGLWDVKKSSNPEQKNRRDY